MPRSHHRSPAAIKPPPAAPPLRVLSVCQPWASLIVDGLKPAENRTWSTRYRGPLVIHASSSRRWLSAATYQWLVGIAPAIKDRTARFELHAWLNRVWTSPGRFLDPMSAIVGSVDLSNCLEADAVPHDELTPWHAFDGFIWSLAGPERLAEPIPALGKLNLWTPDPTLAKKILAALPKLRQPS